MSDPTLKYNYNYCSTQYYIYIMMTSGVCLLLVISNDAITEIMLAGVVEILVHIRSDQSSLLW